MRLFLSTAALAAAGILFAHTPRTAMACSPPATAGRTDVEIVHDQQIIPKGGGILLRVTTAGSPHADPAGAVTVSVKRGDGREMPGSLEALDGASAEEPNAYFVPSDGLAPGGYAVTVTVPASIYGAARSVTGWVRVADEPMHAPTVTFVPSVTAHVFVDDSHTFCCDAEVGPLYGCGESATRGAGSPQIQSSPAPPRTKLCFGDGVSARPRLEVALQTGLSEIENSFLEHRFSALGGGGVLNEQVVRGGASVRAAADWPAPQPEYCFRVETRSLVDGSVSTDIACAPHGGLALAATPTDQTKAEITKRLGICVRAPEGYREEWCAASERNRSYCAWEDGGGNTSGSSAHCDASGARAGAGGSWAIVAIGAALIRIARRRRSS